MVQKVINKIMRRRHFWRTINFDELSELYATQFLRSLASSLIAIFVPVYLFKIGYSVTAISAMFLVWFIVRPIWSYVSARLIGSFGPKHAMAFSIVLQICYLTLVMTVQTLHWPLWLIGIVGSFCFGLYMMAFNVDFSKVKHTEHGGKELSYLQMFERAGAVSGPIIGGLIASFIDPRYTIALAIFVLCASLIPIFRSAEQIQRQQTIIVNGFPWRRHGRNLSVNSAFVLENVVSATIWPFYLGAFVLISNTYAMLGLLTAASTVVAFISIYIIGRLVDARMGKRLLNTGAILNAVLHLVRPLVGVPLQALGVNITNEPLTAMYRMPFLKGMYDAADDVPGYRITYFMLQDMIASAANIVFWSLLVVVAANWSGEYALKGAFIVGAIMSLIITRQRFRALE